MHRLNDTKNWPEMARQADWSAAVLAKNCHVSLRTLQRYFSENMGKTPKKWLAEQRQHQAARLLKDDLSVKEVAARLDYKHPNHLSNTFKNHWGYCPTDKTVPMRAQNP